MNRSEARKKQWAAVPPEVRSERMRQVVSVRHRLMDESQKLMLIKKLQDGKRKQRTKEGN